MASDTTHKSLQEEVGRAKCKCDFEFRCFYPEQNPADAIDSITDALVYVGVFEDLKKIKN